jgi:hypothetical protein
MEPQMDADERRFADNWIHHLIHHWIRGDGSSSIRQMDTVIGVNAGGALTSVRFRG